MTLVQLTEITNGEHRPLSVNPAHVATIRPRKTITAIDAQQGDFRGQVSYNGTILALATGDQHFVTEDFDTVAQLMTTTVEVFTPTGAAGSTEEAAPSGEKAPCPVGSPPPAKKSHHKQPPAKPAAPRKFGAGPGPSRLPTPGHHHRRSQTRTPTSSG